MNNEPTQTPPEDQNRPPQEPTIDAIESPSVEPTFQPSQPQAVSPPKKSKKGLIAAVLVIVILALGGGGAYAYFQLQPTNKTAPVVAASTSPAPIPTPLVPYALVYTDVVTDGKQLSYSPNTTIYQKLLDDSQPLTSLKLTDYHGVGTSAINGEQVAFAELVSSTSKNTTAIYNSTDDGKSFTKLYDIAKGEDITSEAYASDGKSLVIGSSAADSKTTNTAKQIDIATKKVTDLFSVDKSGAYIKGFDSKNGKIYYYKYCYGCDQVQENALYVYDTKSKKTDTLLSTATMSYYGTVLNDTYSKGLRMQNVSTSINETLPNRPTTATISVNEFDVASKKETQLVKLNYTDDKYGYSGSEPIGYTSDNLVYYGYNNTLNIIDKSGKSTILLDAGQLIQNVYYVGKDFVVYQGQSFNDVGSSTRQVIKYDIATKKSTVLFKYSGYSPSIIGLTYK